MQDKDLDQFFRERLSDAELKPSKDLWSGISRGLDKPKRNVGQTRYWAAAASVVLVLSAALLLDRTEKMQLHGKPGVKVVAKISAALPSEARTSATEASVVPERSYASTPLIIAPRVTTQELEKSLVVMQPEVSTNRPDISIGDVNPVVDIKVAEMEPIEKEMFIAKSVAVATVDSELALATQEEEARGIRNAGDLINFVVNKVDKRDKKIIQFHTDDDSSSLISLNLGIINFNRIATRKTKIYTNEISNTNCIDGERTN